MSKLTYLEIRTQFEALEKTCDLMARRRYEIINFYNANSPKRIIVIGCGSSYSIGKAVATTIRLKLHMEAVTLAAGDIMVRPAYYAPLLENAWVMTLSRSGATHEICYAVDMIKEKYGCKIVSVTCAADSPVARQSDMVLELPWAFDESVCQTRSVSNLYAAAQLFVGTCGHIDCIERELRLIAQEGSAYMERIEPMLLQTANKKWDNAFVLADAEMGGIAEEGSLALMEIAYIQSKYNHLLDVRHGPMLLIRDSTLVIVHISEEGKNHQRKLVADLVSKGAGVIVFSDVPIEPIDGVMEHISFGKSLSMATAGIPMLLIAQLVAYHTAIASGMDPDKPVGLDAWISLTK